MQRRPLTCTLAIDCTHLEIIVGGRLEIVEEERIVADSGISLTVEGYLIVVSILHRLPLWSDTIRLNISLEEFWSCQGTLLSQGFIRLIQTCETLHTEFYSLLCDVAGRQTHDGFGHF